MAAQTIFFSPDTYLSAIAAITEEALIAHHVLCAEQAPPETTAASEVFIVPRIHDLAIFD